MTVKGLLKAMTGKQAKIRGSSASAAAPAAAGGGPAGAATGGCAFPGCAAEASTQCSRCKRVFIDLSGFLHGHHLVRAWGATIVRVDYNGAVEMIVAHAMEYKLEGALHADKTQVRHKAACFEEFRRRNLLLGNQVMHSLALASDELLAPLK